MSRADWRRLLVLGRECDAIAAFVTQLEPELDVVAREVDAATEADLRRAEMLLGFKIPAHLADAAAGLKWVQSTGAGVDLLLGPAASGTSEARRGVSATTLLTRVVGVFGDAMSEYVLMHCLAIAQDLERQRRAQAARQWDVFYPRLLSELSIVVLGTGEIGGVIARRLATNGARVKAVNRTGRPVEGVSNVVAIERLHSVLLAADALVVVVPNVSDTRKLIGRRELAAMRRGSWLINVSRGSCVDESALVDALTDGHLGGAVLDVFEAEPLPEGSPLWRMQNVRISPHISGLTRPVDAARAFVDNLRRLRRGEPPIGIVDRVRGY